jgi:hypothetical protein
MTTAKKILIYLIIFITLSITAYTLFIYYFSVSEGVRSGVLSKFSHKGILIKTWEGELNEGFGATRFFPFSVEDNQEQVIEDLKKYQGQYVKLEYTERIKTLPWWGDTHYFIINVTPEKSPYLNSK